MIEPFNYFCFFNLYIHLFKNKKFYLHLFFIITSYLCQVFSIDGE